MMKLMTIFLLTLWSTMSFAQIQTIPDNHCATEKQKIVQQINEDFDLTPSPTNVQDFIRADLLLFRDFVLNELVEKGKCKAIPERKVKVPCEPITDNICYKIIPADTIWHYQKPNITMYNYRKSTAKKYYSDEN